MKNVMKKLMSMILTLALVVGMIGIMPMKAEAEGEETPSYPVWDMTEPYDFTVVEPWSEDRIELSVSETGLYRIYSSERGDSDPCATLYSAEGEQIAYSDDTPDNWEFSLTVYLEAGSVYYLEPTARTEGDTFKIHAEKVNILSVELQDDSTVTLYEENDGYYDLDANGDQYFRYDIDSLAYDLTFRINYVD